MVRGGRRGTATAYGLEPLAASALREKPYLALLIAPFDGERNHCEVKFWHLQPEDWLSLW